MDSTRAIRLGAVGYLNAAPLLRGLASDPLFEIVRDVPARVGAALEGGEIDLGLIPSIDYAGGEYTIVPGVAVASRGEVRSVGLYHRRPLAALRRVALDASSHTSAALLRILLHERLGREPEYVTRPPDLPAMLADADAALLIGDPALYYEGEVARWDLGTAWLESTGLPFVYAFWAGRAEAFSDDVVARLQAAARHGLSELPRVAASYNGHGAGREAFNEDYLRRNIVYDFGLAEQAGLLGFYQRAKERGLIARVPELRFHGHP